MNGYRNARIVPVALSLIVVAVAIAALISVARFMFFPDSTTNNSSKSDSSKEALLNTSVDHAVSVTVRGAIVADENFRSYQIKVNPNQRTLTTYKGYQDQVINNISLSNNVPSYEQFVYALYGSNLIKGTELSGDSDSLAGVCPTGYLYEFNVLKSDSSVKHLWTTSCYNVHGSLDANVKQLLNLFIAQVPNAHSLTNSLWR